MVISLERDADLHMAQLMPLPLSQAVHDKGLLNGCVCVCVCVISFYSTILSRLRPNDSALTSHVVADSCWSQFAGACLECTCSCLVHYYVLVSCGR